MEKNKIMTWMLTWLNVSATTLNASAATLNATFQLLVIYSRLKNIKNYQPKAKMQEK